MSGPASVAGRARTRLASMALYDFASSGVDEDLEQMRSAWKKPEDELLYRPASPEMSIPMPGHGKLRQLRKSSLVERPGWQGPLDGPPMSTSQPRRAVVGYASERLPSTGVAGGPQASLGDYRSNERLASLAMLRKLSEKEAGGCGCASRSIVPAGGAFPPPRTAAARGTASRSATELERIARASVASRGPSDDWASWEARWAEQLRDFGAYQKQLRAQAQAALEEHWLGSDDFGDGDGDGDPAWWAMGRGAGPQTHGAPPPPRFGSAAAREAEEPKVRNARTYQTETDARRAASSAKRASADGAAGGGAARDYWYGQAGELGGARRGLSSLREEAAGHGNRQRRRCAVASHARRVGCGTRQPRPQEGATQGAAALAP